MKSNRKVLITGAAGNIGSKLRQYFDGKYQLRLTDISSRGDGTITEVDLSKWSKDLTDIFEGIDAVIHMAADPHESKSWQELVPTNLDATINVFMAAANAGVKCFIFASSNHVMGGYKDKPEVKFLATEMPPLPGTHFSRGEIKCDSTPYGAMKLFGERLAKCYAYGTQMSTIAVRIGWVQHGENKAEDLPVDSLEWYKLMWLSNRDLCQLMERCIEAKLSEPFVIVNGMSNNDGMVWDIEYTRKLLGFEPQDGRKVQEPNHPDPGMIEAK